MLNRIRQYIAQEHLLPPTGKVLVALSGGADSVALLDILCRLGYDCHAAHCNFHLRGEESDRDEAFVKTLCQTLGVPLSVQHFNTTAYAQEHSISIEMAARDLRYAWFAEERQIQDCCAIAVAHHANDQAETILLNLQRGTGLRGLEGMHAKNGYVVRPLLCVTREDIDSYLTIRHLAHVEDSTNTDTAYQRNAIRRQIRDYSRAQIEHIANTGVYMQQYELLVNDYMASLRHRLTKQNGQELHIDIEGLLQTPSPVVVLYELLRPYGFRQTDEILRSLTANSGKRFYAEQYMVLKDRNCLIVSPAVESESGVPKIKHIIRKRLPKEIYPAATANRIIVDAKVTEQPLGIRHWQTGDWFYPIGMHQKKKLQDFFSDEKLSLIEKEKVWLLCSGDNIVWIAGHRIDNRYKVTPLTEQVAEIWLDEEQDN